MTTPLNEITNAVIQVKHHIIIKPPIIEQRNVSTMCKLHMSTKSTSTSVQGAQESREVQTESYNQLKLIPIPVPIYVPVPLHMYTAPVPYPLPFPLPVPVPTFIPTTRNSAKGIMKEIKKIHVKTPIDPYEAELLMMAEMVSGGDKKEDNSDSEGDDNDDDHKVDGDDVLDGINNNLPFGHFDMLTQQHNTKADPMYDNPIIEQQSSCWRKRGPIHEDNNSADDCGDVGAKRRRKISTKSHHSTTELPSIQSVSPITTAERRNNDAHCCIKYMFGVNAWKQWVTKKNSDWEESSHTRKLFKTDILQLTSNELNRSLSLFVNEVRKPNGAEYAPDTVYYLTLGIQQYLFENGRIDNLFCDLNYEQFADSLNEVARKFSVIYNDSHYIVTRIEEEHLWQSNQLGAHSPYVLLNTLVFFNTKYFNLTTVQEHMQMSFSHIIKHWKRNPTKGRVSESAGPKTILLRFYSPPTVSQTGIKEKNVFEQYENVENPLRCPVKLYEFYLLKCPENVKTRSDAFYLQPERSCVPDSPLWYSTTSLYQDALEKMLNRVKMVKEINVALLTN